MFQTTNQTFQYLADLQEFYHCPNVLIVHVDIFIPDSDAPGPDAHLP